MTQGKINPSKTSDGDGGDDGVGYTLPGQGMNKVPTVLSSERKMMADVPAALSVLRRNNATDLLEMLGLDQDGNLA